MKRTIRKLLMLATCWILLGLAGCGKATPWPSTGCPQITQPYFGPAGNVYNCESRTESVATDSSSKDICNVQCQVFGAAHCPYPPDGYASFEFNTTSMTGDPAPDNGSVGSLASLTTSLQCFLVPVKGVCPESSLPVVEQLGDPASQEYRVRCIPVDRPADAETSTGDDATMVMPETTCEEAVPQDVVEHGTEEEHDEFSEFSTTKIPRCQSCETDADCEGDLQCHNEACGLPEAGLAGATCACVADCAQGLICKD